MKLSYPNHTVVRSDKDYPIVTIENINRVRCLSEYIAFCGFQEENGEDLYYVGMKYRFIFYIDKPSNEVAGHTSEVISVASEKTFKERDTPKLVQFCYHAFNIVTASMKKEYIHFDISAIEEPDFIKYGEAIAECLDQRGFYK